MNRNMISGMSKLFVFALTTVMTLTLSQNVAEASHIKTEGATNIRQEANQNSLALAQVLSTQDNFTVTGEKYGVDGFYWFSVKYGDVNGYMRSDCLVLDEPLNATVNDNGINIRKTAEIKSNNILSNYKLYLGQRISVLGEENDFYLIQYNGKIYYAHSDYINLDSENDISKDEIITEDIIEKEQENKEETTEEVKEEVKVSNLNDGFNATVKVEGNLNIRKKPSTLSAKAGKLTNSSRILVVAKTSTNWYQILFNNEKLWISSEFATLDDGVELEEIAFETATDLVDVVEYAKQFVGYSRSSFVDCSRFVQIMFETFGINLERCSASQAAVNCISIQRQELQVGDLVFFSGSYYGWKIGHVGIYVGDNKFISNESDKVRISSLDDPYFWGKSTNSYVVQSYGRIVLN